MIKQLSNIHERATVDSNQEPENQIDLKGGVSQMGFDQLMRASAKEIMP
jgi:hypothetical protein